MIAAVLKYNFLQHALIGAVLASVVCGIIGTIIVEKKMVMMSGGIAHTAFGGVGMGYFLKIEPMVGALIFSVTSALGISRIKRHSTANTDVLIGMFWPLGMALGILFIAFTPGYPPDMSSYLFGDILTVSRQDLITMGFLTGTVILAVTAFFNLIKAYLFDEEFSTALGLHTRLVESLVFILIAVTVVVIIRIVGIILILALLCVPPAIARMITFDLKRVMLLAVFLGALFCMSGLWISYRLGVASGASIVIISVTSYFLVTLIHASWKKICHRESR